MRWCRQSGRGNHQPTHLPNWNQLDRAGPNLADEDTANHQYHGTHYPLPISINLHASPLTTTTFTTVERYPERTYTIVMKSRSEKTNGLFFIFAFFLCSIFSPPTPTIIRRRFPGPAPPPNQPTNHPRAASRHPHTSSLYQHSVATRMIPRNIHRAPISPAPLFLFCFLLLPSRNGPE